MTIIIKDKGAVRLRAEGTYGTNPGSFADADTVFAKSLEVDSKVEAIEVDGITARRNGLPDISGEENNTFKVITELNPVAVAAPTPVTSRSLCHKWLEIGGFEITDATVANNLEYKLCDYDFPSYTMEYFQRNKAGTGGRKWVGTGARADSVIKAERGQLVMLELDGQFKELTPTDDTTTIAPVYQDTNSEKRLSLDMVSGVSVTILASTPSGVVSFSGKFLSMEIRTNNKLATVRNSADDIQEILPIGGKPEVDLKIEHTQIADFDYRGYRNGAKDSLAWVVTVDARDATSGTTDSVSFAGTAYINDVEDSFEDERLVVNLKATSG